MTTPKLVSQNVQFLYVQGEESWDERGLHTKYDTLFGYDGDFFPIAKLSKPPESILSQVSPGRNIRFFIHSLHSLAICKW